MTSAYTSTSVSLPTKLLKEVERVRKKRMQSRSEVVREALQEYVVMNRTPYTPTKKERKAIELGRRAIERGDYVVMRTPEDIDRVLGLDTKE